MGTDEAPFPPSPSAGFNYFQLSPTVSFNLTHSNTQKGTITFCWVNDLQTKSTVVLTTDPSMMDYSP